MHLMLCVYDYITETVTICKLKLLGINNSLKPCSQYSLLDSLFDETYARLVWVGVFQDWCGLPF